MAKAFGPGKLEQPLPPGYKTGGHWPDGVCRTCRQHEACSFELHLWHTAKGQGQRLCVLSCEHLQKGD